MGAQHDEPNCDPSVDCKFVGPRDCPCRCHSVASGAENESLTDEELAEMDARDGWIAEVEARRLLAEVLRLRKDNAVLERMFEDAERLCARCGKELDGSQAVVNDLANRYEAAMHRIEELEEELRVVHAPDDFEEFGHPLDGAGDNPRFPA